MEMKILEKPIAVLGGGNGGHCMAADLTLAGHQVNFYEHPGFESGFRATLESGTVELIGIGRTGKAKINLVTMDMAEAINNVDSALSGLLIILLIVGAITLCIGAFLSFYIGGKISRSIKKMVGVSDMLAAGDINQTIDHYSNDETGKLASEITKKLLTQ